MSRRPSFVVLAALALACGAVAPSSPLPAATAAPGLATTLDAGNQPVEPFRILGNLYYVGASDLAAFLIDTGSGLIVLDGGLAATAPQIRDNIVRLGKSPRDVKILLNSHAAPAARRRDAEPLSRRPGLPCLGGQCRERLPPAPGGGDGGRREEGEAAVSLSC